MEKGASHFRSFLSNWSQCMIIECCYSSPCKVTSGVPQSSVLGTTLFLIFIYHLIGNIQSTIRLFANDCLTYWSIAIFFHWSPSATTRSRYSYLPAGLKHGGCNLMLINILSFSYPNTITRFISIFYVRQAPQDHWTTVLFRNSNRPSPFLEPTNWLSMQQGN